MNKEAETFRWDCPEPGCGAIILDSKAAYNHWAGHRTGVPPRADRGFWALVRGDYLPATLGIGFFILTIAMTIYGLAKFAF